MEREPHGEKLVLGGEGINIHACMQNSKAKWQSRSRRMISGVGTLFFERQVHCLRGSYSACPWPLLPLFRFFLFSFSKT